MISERKNVLRVVINLFVVLGCHWLMQTPLPAAAKTQQEFIDQALINALGTCYTNTYTNSSFTLSDGDRLYSKMLTDAGKNANIYLPFQANPISCESVIIKVKTDVFHDDSIPNDPTRFGYRLSSTTSTPSSEKPNKCISISYQYFDGAWLDGKTAQSCFSVNDDGSVNKQVSFGSGSVTGPYEMSAIFGDAAPNNHYLYMGFDEVGGEGLWGFDLDIFTVKQDNVSQPGSWQAFVDKVDAEMAKYTNKNSNIIANYSVYGGDDPNYNPTDQESTYNKLANGEAADVFLRTVSSNSSIKVSDYSFSKQDKVDILKVYIEQALSNSSGDGLSLAMTEGSCWADRNSVTAEYAYPVSGRGWCELRNVDAVPGTDYITISDNLVKGGKTFTHLMNSFMTLTKDSDVDVSGVDDPTLNNPAPGTSAGDADTVAACYSGTGVLGWIVCPVMEAVGSATGWMYKKAIEPALQIKTTELFGQGTKSGTYSVWSTFRGFANILFAIAFVIIILSQITGIGISNYGIKKMLPRLIMVVVLINVSYILCQLAVDASNILGSSIKSTLTNIQIAGAEQTELPEMIGMILNGLGLAGAATFGVSTALGSKVVLAGLQYLAIPLLLAVIGCIIGILFFFILLSVRQAGVVILVILSPIAVICYALPNTKSLFDRWKKLFTAMLLVYPICGLVMGGGTLAGALLLNAAQPATVNGVTEFNNELGFFYTISAMLMNVVPFFFIPSILKGSMALAGNLGAKISSFGAGLGRGLNRGIRNTTAYKERQQERGRVLELRRNQTRVGRYSKTGGGGGVIGSMRRRLGMNNNLSEYRQALVAQSQNSIDRSTGDVGSALRIGWENDGSADNLGGFDDKGKLIGGDNIMNRYLQATRDLQKDPNDYGALERQRAAASILLSNGGKGRSLLFEANRVLMDEMSAMSGSAQNNARQILRRTANNLMRSNSADIGKSGLLSSQLKMLKRSDIAVDQLSQEILDDSIGGLNTQSMSSMSKKDLEYYIGAINDGKIKHGSTLFDRVTSAAAKAMSDPHYKGNIEADSMPFMKELANMRYAQSGNVTSNSGYGTSVTSAIAGASEDELARIRADLSTPDGVPAAQRDQMLQNLSNTLIRGAQDPRFNLSSSRASQIDEILRENNVDVVAAGAAAGVADMQGALDAMTGLKVQHAPRQTLQDQHSNWRRATAADVRAVVGGRGPHARVPFAEGEWIKTDGNKLVKLSGAEAAEADLLEKADAEAVIAQRQADFQAEQRRQARQNGGNP